MVESGVIEEEIELETGIEGRNRNQLSGAPDHERSEMDLILEEIEPDYAHAQQHSSNHGKSAIARNKKIIKRSLCAEIPDNTASRSADAFVNRGLIRFEANPDTYPKQLSINSWVSIYATRVPRRAQIAFPAQKGNHKALEHEEQKIERSIAPCQIRHDDSSDGTLKFTMKKSLGTFPTQLPSCLRNPTDSRFYMPRKSHATNSVNFKDSTPYQIQLSELQKSDFVAGFCKRFGSRSVFQRVFAVFGVGDKVAAEHLASALQISGLKNAKKLFFSAMKQPLLRAQLVGESTTSTPLTHSHRSNLKGSSKRTHPREREYALSRNIIEYNEKTPFNFEMFTSCVKGIAQSLKQQNLCENLECCCQPVSSAPFGSLPSVVTWNLGKPHGAKVAVPRDSSSQLHKPLTPWTQAHRQSTFRPRTSVRRLVILQDKMRSAHVKKVHERSTQAETLARQKARAKAVQLEMELVQIKKKESKESLLLQVGSQIPEVLCQLQTESDAKVIRDVSYSPVSVHLRQKQESRSLAHQLGFDSRLKQRIKAVSSWM